MLDYKRMCKWLIIIPFCVMHIFGSPSVSSLFVRNIFSKDFIANNFFGRACTGLEEDACRRESKNIDKDRSFDQEGFVTENSCNNFLKNFMDKISNNNYNNNNLSKEIIVCDNRIDKIDKEFSESAYFYDNYHDSDICEMPNVVFA